MPSKSVGGVSKYERVMNERPKVSVSLITYNHAQFIARSIESALSQRTDFDFEIVIGDDLSTDGTTEIVGEFARKFPGKIRVVPHDRNLGLVKNAINNIRMCKGEYIALLEGDDYWTDPEKLQMQANLLDQNPNLAFCVTNSVNYFQDTGKSDVLYHKPLPDQFDLSFFLINNVNLANNTKMFRSNSMPAQLPTWYYNYHVWDWLLHIFMAEKGDIGYIHQTTLLYNRHSNAFIINLPAEKNLKDGLRIMEQMNVYFKGRFAEVWDRTWWNHEELALIALRKKQYRAFLIEALKSLWPIKYRNLSNLRGFFWKFRKTLRLK